MIEIGGEIKTKGTNQSNTPWKIGIESPDPTGRTVQKIVDLNNLSLATSGNYRNYFEKDGVRYSHILSPETLKPVTHKTASVSVVHGDCGAADGWATALLALPPKEALNVAEQYKIAAFFILSKGSGFTTLTTSEFERIFKDF
jgi:thiamine biosynthesis lipoprotein